MSDAGSKYTNPTGPGYAGIYASTGYGVEISIGATQHVDWTPSTFVVAVDHPDTPGIQLVDEDKPDAIVECNVRYKGAGTIVSVRPPATRELDGFEPGEGVRVYEYGDNSLTIVPADDDPFVSSGGSDS